MPSDSLPAGLVQVIRPHAPSGPSSSAEEAMSAVVTSALLDPGESIRGHCQLEQSEGDFRRFASAIHQVACDV